MKGIKMSKAEYTAGEHTLRGVGWGIIWAIILMVMGYLIVPLSGRVKNNESNVQNLDTRVAVLETRISEGFSRIEKKLDKIEEKLENQ
jgi:uncharacterized membrane protein